MDNLQQDNKRVETGRDHILLCEPIVQSPLNMARYNYTGRRRHAVAPVAI